MLGARQGKGVVDRLLLLLALLVLLTLGLARTGGGRQPVATGGVYAGVASVTSFGDILIPLAPVPTLPPAP